MWLALSSGFARKVQEWFESNYTPINTVETATVRYQVARIRNQTKSRNIIDSAVRCSTVMADQSDSLHHTGVHVEGAPLVLAPAVMDVQPGFFQILPG